MKKKLKTCIILFLVTINFSCSSLKNQKPNDIYECPRPEKPSFGKLGTSRFDSLERQKEMLSTINTLKNYCKDQDSTIDCYENQFKGITDGRR